jgi:hypothetical protein
VFAARTAVVTLESAATAVALHRLAPRSPAKVGSTMAAARRNCGKAGKRVVDLPASLTPR